MPPVRDQVLLAGLTTLGVGGPARRFVPASTDADLIAAVQAADEQREPLLILGGGSNLVIADAGFPGTVVQIATRGIQQATVPAADGRGAADRGGRRGLGRRGRVLRRRRPGRPGVPVRHPRPHRRHPDPERRCLRPGSGRGHQHGPGVRPGHRRGDRAGRPGLRVRLPDQHVQAGQQRAAGRPRGDVRTTAQRAVRARPVRRAGPGAGRAGGRPGPARRGAVGRAHAAPGQGHGARPGRPGQPQRRARSSPTRCWTTPSSPRCGSWWPGDPAATCPSRSSPPGQARSRCPPPG